MELRVDDLLVDLLLAQVADVERVFTVWDLLLEGWGQILESDVFEVDLRDVGQLFPQNVVFFLLLDWVWNTFVFWFFDARFALSKPINNIKLLLRHHIIIINTLPNFLILFWTRYHVWLPEQRIFVQLVHVTRLETEKGLVHYWWQLVNCLRVKLGRSCMTACVKVFETPVNWDINTYLLARNSFNHWNLASWVVCLDGARERLQPDWLQVHTLIQTMWRSFQINASVDDVELALWLQGVLVERLKDSVLVATLSSELVVEVFLVWTMQKVVWTVA